MNNLIKLILKLSILGLLYEQRVVSEDISDKDFFAKYDEIIEKLACDAMAQTDGSAMKVNLSRYSTHEELAKMAFWNYGNDFSTKKMTFPADIKWKRDLLDSLFEIFKASCATQYVPHGYMNIFQEFAMIYLNSVETKSTTDNTAVWEPLRMILNMCKEDITPYLMTMKEYSVIGMTGAEGNIIETVELYPPEDKVDRLFSNVDLVVDNMWWVFSHALGHCYPNFKKPAIVAPRLKALFIKDILRPLMNRWADPGPLQNFGPIIGNYDITRAQRNIRFCVTAAYFRNGITELQMVRPLKVGYKEEGISYIINKKTGATFG